MSMDSGSWTLYIFLLLLILGGGYFAAAETAFASVNRLRLQNKAEDGNQKANPVLNTFGLKSIPVILSKKPKKCAKKHRPQRGRCFCYINCKLNNTVSEHCICYFEEACDVCTCNEVIAKTVLLCCKS